MRRAGWILAGVVICTPWSAADAATIRAGRIEVEPGGTQQSYLCVPGDVLMNLLCPAESGPGSGPVEEGRIIIRNGGGGHREVKVTTFLREGPGQVPRSGFTLVLTELRGEPLSLPCGTFDWHYELPPTWDGSSFGLMELTPVDVVAGTFTADLWAEGSIVFEAGDLPVATLPYRLSATYTGNYVVVPDLSPAAGALSAAGYSNLVAFAASTDRGRTVCPVPRCATVSACGWMCLGPSAETLALVNGHTDACAGGMH